MAKEFWCGFNTIRRLPDAWLVIEICQGDYDYVPYYDEDGREEEVAETMHGGKLAAICATKEEAQEVARYLSL